MIHLLTHPLDVSPNERSYDGEWVRDAMDGQGVYKFRNGGIYVGEMRHDKMHGHGVMKYVNGHTTYDVYEGEFVDDKRNGLGTMTYVKGDVFRGEWKDDNFVPKRGSHAKPSAQFDSSHHVVNTAYTTTVCDFFTSPGSMS